MLDRDSRHALELPAAAGESDESWLTSYLDVLTLLITLFVLLLALTPPGGGEGGDSDAMRAASAVTSLPLASLATGIHPRHDGLQPQMAGLDIPGVSVSQGQEGVTLRIDDSLLFPSGNDVLTPQGQDVLERLSSVLETFDGQISVEGHTDNVPISTSRFPSNWELSVGRAIAVVRQLERQGIAISRMRAVGYADTQPMESNATSEGRAANRRVELLLRQQVEG
ncbi:OmpA family protein [Halomonas meridiana]|uniref:Flagellar motor protein MotB n=1 Tax=Vreelandella aquamarina TaxID=77097 RepID=A0A857GI97_9GAMM|nr:MULTISPECIES: OmpA family protein [Halomonas]MAO61814.1 flagellar motor protein MotB [Halomonas sp.]MDK9688563.1 OmpA family protein [Halomonas sp. LC1]MDP4559191.1 OmpA family protein [Halomonas meridiana]QHD48306.1 flagellar motor protein MotB [Halomonas meridiana]HBM29878.1 flagellar motor protein MotB [Halomonas sp.]|tara:strand:+ start:2150 stop:2821 length:672 start_codon:yes stop_codon:yes gene_type:complete